MKSSFVPTACFVLSQNQACMLCSTGKLKYIGDVTAAVAVKNSFQIFFDSKTFNTAASLVAVASCGTANFS